MSGVGKAFFGDCGGSGNDWRVGSGAPSIISGDEEGDLYLDTDNGDVYQVQSGSWVLVANIEGPTGPQGPQGDPGVDGNDWRVGSGAPSIISGDEEGDLYLDTDNGDVYQVQSGSWVLVANIEGPAGADGSEWHSGSGPPAGGLGDEGDFYLDTDNGDVYEKTGPTTWTLVDNLTGPAGPGVPTGGDPDDYLAKVSSTDFDTEWRPFEGDAITLGETANTVAHFPHVVVPFSVIREEVPATSIFTFDNANDTLEVGKDGLYGLAFHLTHITGGATPMNPASIRTETFVEVDTGGGFAQPTNTPLIVVDNGLFRSNQFHYEANTMILSLSAGDKIRMKHGRTAGSISNAIIGSGTFLHVWKIK